MISKSSRKKRNKKAKTKMIMWGEACKDAERNDCKKESEEDEESVVKADPRRSTSDGASTATRPLVTQDSKITREIPSEV